MRIVLSKPSGPVLAASLLVAGMLSAGTPSALSSQILVPSQSVAPGISVTSPVAFKTQGSPVSGVQFDVEYDNSVMGLTATLADSAGNSGKSLYAVDLAPNKKRILIIGLNQSLIPDGTLVNFFVNITPSAPSGSYGLTLSNVYGTDPAGNAAAVTGGDGTITVNGGAPAPLQSNGVLNAGSLLPGPVAPGELITLIGTGIGPVSALQSSGSAINTVLGGISVLFDGTAAPLLYAGPNQINTIVPFEIYGEAVTQLTITSRGQPLAGVALAAAAASPAIFTQDSTGVGAGAILNQDSSVNSPANPASKGSVVSIFATGAGQSNPGGVDGQVTGTVLPTPLLPVSVQIGGLDAKVEFVGAAPGLVSGVLQVNARIAAFAPSGSAIPVALTVGQTPSQTGVTVAIR